MVGRLTPNSAAICATPATPTGAALPPMSERVQRRLEAADFLSRLSQSVPRSVRAAPRSSSSARQPSWRRTHVHSRCGRRDAVEVVERRSNERRAPRHLTLASPAGPFGPERALRALTATLTAATNRSQKRGQTALRKVSTHTHPQESTSTRHLHNGTKSGQHPSPLSGLEVASLLTD